MYVIIVQNIMKLSSSINGYIPERSHTSVIYVITALEHLLVSRHISLYIPERNRTNVTYVTMLLHGMES